MTRGLLVAAVLGLGALLLVGVFMVVLRPAPAEVASSPTPVATATPSATPSPTASPSLTATPTLSTVAAATSSPSATPSVVRYVNTAFGYSVVLPPPYRHSDLLSFPSPPPDPSQPKASDAFTVRTPADELAGTQSCETACPAWRYTALVVVYTDAGSMTPRQFYAAGRAGSSVTEQLEDTTVSGQPALRVINGARFPLQLIVAKGGRMYLLSYQLGDPAPDGASLEKLRAILDSFAFTP